MSARKTARIYKVDQTVNFRGLDFWGVLPSIYEMAVCTNRLTVEVLLGGEGTVEQK